jgi:hypothetical protein
MTEMNATKTIAQEIEELRHLPVVDLIARYGELFGRPPRCKHRDSLWRRCAHELQVQRLGGLSEVARRHLDRLVAEIDLPASPAARTVRGKLKPSNPGRERLAVGTELRRRWKGQEIVLRVTEQGFEHERVLYRSLTEAVRAITGSHWNAKLFFNLATRRRVK